MKSPRTALLALFTTVLTAVIVLFAWHPWRADPSLDGNRAAGPDAAKHTATADGRKAATPIAVDAAAEAADTTREAIPTPVHTIVFGTLLGPEGMWPGAGDVELIPAASRVGADPMSLFSMGIEQARKAQRRALAEKPAEKPAKKPAANPTAEPTGDKPGNLTQGDRSDEMLRILGLAEPVGRTMVEGSGQFGFDNPPEGRFEVRLDHPFLELREPVVIEVEKGVSVNLGVLPTRAVASLMVLAFDDDGRPIENVHVEIHRQFDPSQFMNPAASGSTTELFRRMIPKSGNTDRRGAHLFKALDPNEAWFLVATKDGYTSKRRVLHLQPARENLSELDMQAGASLLVSATLPDGRRCDRAHVTIEFQDYRFPEGFAHRMGTSGKQLSKGFGLGPNGRRKIVGLHAGKAIVRLDTPGYRSQAKTIELTTDGPDAAIGFQLEEGEVVSGRILDEKGAPLPKAKLLPFRDTGRGPLGMDLADLVGDVFGLEVARRGIPVDSEGRFRVGGMQPDETAKLVAVAAGHDVGEASVTAGQVDIEIRLRKLAVLRGRVVTAADGEAIEAFEVKLVQRTFMVMEKNVAREQFDGRKDGAFVLEEVPRDQFQIVVAAAGFSPWSSSVDAREGDVDDLMIRMLPAAGIAGIVLDTERQPVAGATIRIVRGGIADTMAMASGLGNGDATSDETGRFQLDQLKGRKVRLLVDKDGFAPVKTPGIRLLPGEVTDDVVVELANGGSIHGVLVDVDGKPLAGWRAQASHTGGIGVRVGETDENGVFELAGLAPGTQKVDCMPKDYATRIGVGGGRDSLQDIDLTKVIARTMKWVTSDRVVVRANERTEVKLIFAGGEDETAATADTIRVEGTVRVGEQELSSGLLFLTEVGGTAQGPVVRVEKGSFAVPRVAPGRYRCRVQAGLLSGTIGQPQPLVIPADADRVHRVAIQLPGGGLVGRVVDATGKPAAGIVLALSDTKDAVGLDRVALDRMDIGEGTLLTDKNGAFHFRGLLPGRYAIFAKDAILGRGAARRSGALANLAIGNAETRRDLVLRLGDGGSLDVHVLDDRGPRANATVTLLDARGRPVSLFQRSLTDGDGVVQLGSLPPGEYRVAVDAPKVAARVSDKIAILDGTERRVDISLDPGVPVTATIGSPAGKTSAAGADMILYTIYREDGMHVRSGQARVREAGGAWGVGSLMPGTYHVRLESRRFGVLAARHTVPTQGSAAWTFAVK